MHQIAIKEEGGESMKTLMYDLLFRLFIYMY